MVGPGLYWIIVACYLVEPCLSLSLSLSFSLLVCILYIALSLISILSLPPPSSLISLYLSLLFIRGRCALLPVAWCGALRRWCFLLFFVRAGDEELHWHGLQRDHGAPRHPPKHAREPRMVHRLHTLPGRDFSGASPVTPQLPDHGATTIITGDHS